MACQENFGLVDGVRLLTSDVDPENQLLTDDQYMALLELYDGDARRAAARALRTMAASEVLLSKKITTQDLSTDGPAVAAELRKQAEQLEAEADALAAGEGAGSFAAFIPGPGASTALEGVEARVAYPW